MVNEVPVKYLAPGRYDVANYGTIYKVMGDGESYEYFVQLSEDLESPDWKPIGFLIEKTFEPYLMNKEFMNACLNIHAKKGNKSEQFKYIANVITK